MASMMTKEDWDKVYSKAAPTLKVELHFRGFDGRPPFCRDFPHAYSCKPDGAFICVTDEDGQYWFPAETVIKASAYPIAAPPLTA